MSNLQHGIQNDEPEEDAPTKKDPSEKKGKHGHRPHRIILRPKQSISPMNP